MPHSSAPIRQDREKHQAHVVRGLVDLLQYDSEKSFESTNKRLIRGSLVTVVLWCLLTGTILVFTPKSHFQPLMETEQQVCSVAFVLLLVSNVSRFLPLIYKDRVIEKNKTNHFKNGFMVAAFTVQGIAMVACALMAFFPTPVLVDPITNARVFLVRWAEWAPLGFLLTLLSEEIDVPTEKNKRDGVLHAILQGTVVSAGFVFPLIEDRMIWSAVAVVACTLYSHLFVRIHEKWLRLQSILQSGIRKTTEPQNYHRLRLSLRSLQECGVLWTLLILLHFVSGFLPHYLPEGHLLNTPALPMLAETFCEVASKHLHILVVESVLSTFCEKSRNEQTLDLLRRTMTMVWERSSDTIGISLQKQERKICMISPTFFSLASSSSDIVKEWDEPVAVVFEIPIPRVNQSIARVYCISLPDSPYEHDEHVEPFDLPTELRPSVNSIAEIIEEAWNQDDGSLLPMDFVKSQDGEKENGSCEVTVSKMKDSTMVCVIRDISERVRRFQTEKQLAVELTEREKDSQTNRFTRHEIKNGLLAAIALCEGLKEGAENSSTPSKQEITAQNFTDLESTLNEILDTVVSEVMSRDVVHEVYVPREESVNLLRLLGSTRKQKHRFPIQHESPVPDLSLDPQLLRFIHRNAISNACKYGKPGGSVSTVVHYDPNEQILSIDVVNEPGRFHEKLLHLGEKAENKVFQPGCQLHRSETGDVREVSFSSGDGAWVSRKCALMLGGDVSISFKQERTVFNLTIPAKAYHVQTPTTVEGPDFIPCNTIGVAIDDSKVQRKLLDRMFSILGIEEKVVLGSNLDEVLNFPNTVRNLLSQYPDCKLLIIADENLDIEQSDHNYMLSGSACIEQLRRELPEDDEARILALVRSANDSSHDLAVYSQRTHGFLRKAPIRPASLREMVRPLWLKRFPEAEEDSTKSNTAPQSLGKPARSSISKVASRSSPDSAASKRSSMAPLATGNDLMQVVETLDDMLLFQTEDDISWNQIREKLSLLKGDVMTLINQGNSRVVAVREALEELRMENDPPPDLKRQWTLIRELIRSLV